MSLFCTYDNTDSRIFIKDEILNEYDGSVLSKIHTCQIPCKKINGAFVLEDIEYDIFVMICKLLVHKFDYNYICLDIYKLPNTIYVFKKSLIQLNIIPNDELCLKINKYTFIIFDKLNINIKDIVHNIREYKNNTYKKIQLENLDKNSDDLYFLQ